VNSRTVLPGEDLAELRAKIAAAEARDRMLRRLGYVIVVVLGLGVAVFLGRGGSRPQRPQLLSGDAAVPSARVQGFDEVAVHVQLSPAPGAPAPRVMCDLLAITDQQRNKGLMGRHDLAGYDGMVFAFPSDTRTAFYMRSTPLPLSIAWFEAHGVYLSAAAMAPCGADPNCPLTHPPGPYRVAIEVPQGNLQKLGLIQGATITIGGPCPISG
jgi:uncharacterized membrane protein (UPF0127 family)